MSMIRNYADMAILPSNIDELYAGFTTSPLSFITFLLIVGWWIFRHRFNQRHNKGPKTWPVIGCIIEQAKNFNFLHDWLLNYFKETPTFSVPMMTVNNTFTSTPANVEYILKTNFANYPKGERIQERFIDMMGLGIFNVDGDLWHQQRKVSTVEFASSKLRDLSTQAFREQALKLGKVLLLATQTSQVVDLQDLFMRLTLDSICKIGFGVDVGCLTPSLPIIPFAAAFDEANELLIRRYVDFTWKIKRALNIGSEARLRKCIEVVNSFLYEVIEARRAEMQLNSFEQNEKRADILSRFMSLTGPDAYDDKMLRDVVVNFIIAGRDTTALTLSWLFSQLCKHPDVIHKILFEVSAVLNEEDTSCIATEQLGLWDKMVNFAQRLNYQNLNKMQYLHATITETLRLYPAVPLETKKVKSDDTLPDGTPVKQGNFVSFAPYSMGRLERIWGPDADEFKPERWLVDGVFQPQSPFKLTAFQAGPRICLGKDSAYLQMKMTTAILLKFFKFDLVVGQSLSYRMMVVLYIANGLKAVVSLRQGEAL
ncbi:hypothetical protein O6H91_15G073300 [Diphasiastrum complanatum]|uniref:Uncharacterized protein n=1 Tax=Diphasiastrum complanatum TaxID=34168 RepID=A0ACC2BKH2_DIPCM|nr:hypothetical protein O6H91_15G073300 [Diphasiastrum complanatum]